MKTFGTILKACIILGLIGYFFMTAENPLNDILKGGAAVVFVLCFFKTHDNTQDIKTAIHNLEVRIDGLIAAMDKGSAPRDDL